MAVWTATTGSCVMKAKDLFATGFAVEVLDDDPVGSDTILAKTTIKPSEASLLGGQLRYTNSTTCQDLTITLTRQP